MKRLSLFLTAFLLVLSFFPTKLIWAETPELRANERQFLLLWQDDQVAGSGLHRPFTALTLQDEKGTTLWTGKTDPRGTFSFLLNATQISPSASHVLTIHAQDQFQRPLLKNDGSPDDLKATLLPGLKTSGHTDAGADIVLFDAQGKMLQHLQADEKGFYALFNAPEKSTVRISTKDQKKDIPFVSGTMPDTFLVSTPEKPAAPESAPGTLTAPTFQASSSSGIFLWTFGGVVIIGGIGVGIFIFLKKRNAESF